jgi:negative regulator of replication initiation
MQNQIMVKNIRLNDHTYIYLASKERYPESISDTLDRLLGIKTNNKEKNKIKWAK